MTSHAAVAAVAREGDSGSAALLARVTTDVPSSWSNLFLQSYVQLVLLFSEGLA